MIPAIAFPFSGLDAVFAVSAVVGGVMFMIRMILLLIGVGHDGDFSGMDHGDVGGHDFSHVDGVDGFHLFTVNGAMGFFMIFGLLGLALHRGSHVGEAMSIVGAFAGGTAMMAAVAKLFQVMQGFQSSGNLDYRSAIGQIGAVYLNIPEDGSGQIEVCINNQLRVMDAVSDDHQPIKTGERVEILNLIGANTFVVRRV